MPSKNVPSLENLVNQCCENYYSRLNESVADELNIEKLYSKEDPNNQYYSYEKFQDFINASHCQENLKFLIEIYHYEKIWNRTFKRQSSILKCKDEEVTSFFPSSGSRKQSVATIRTMNSKKSNRHPSIVEEVPSNQISPLPSQQQQQQQSQQPQPSDLEQTSSLSTNEDDPNSPITEATSSSEHGLLSHNDLDKLVHELSLPKILKSGDDIDTHSFLNQDFNKTAYDPKATRYTTQSSTSPSKRHSTEVWDSLFKPSYICENDSECVCHTNNPDLEQHRHNDSDSDEFNEGIQQQEILEQLKFELREKFEFIMTNYVINNSPEQINLPDTVYSNLLKEYENNTILYHSPLTLLPSKNAVLQLLRENIYYNFLVDQENLINKENSHKIIKKMDELKISNTHSSSSIPTVTTSTPVPSDTTTISKSRELKISPPNASSSTSPGRHPVSIRSTSSEESLKSRSNTPISTISNFLNKYHIKIHHSNSSSSLTSQLTDTTSSSNSNASSQHQSPTSPIVKARIPKKAATFSSSTSSSPISTPSSRTTFPLPSNSSRPSTEMKERTRTSADKKYLNKHHHSHHPAQYVKGPCGIEPEISDYDPHPPIEKEREKEKERHGWSKMAMRFKHKK